MWGVGWEGVMGGVPRGRWASDACSSPFVRVVTPSSPSIWVAMGGSGSAAVAGGDGEAVPVDFLYPSRGSLRHRWP